MVNIHYFYDPMCGWCYGATPLVAALVENKAVNLHFHCAGMLNSQVMTMAFRSHILAADSQINTLTGMRFGDAYKQRIQTDNNLTLDSYLPTQAIVAAKKQGIAEYAMLSAIQHAHYVNGLPVNELATLVTIATELGADKNRFKTDMAANKTHALNHIAHSKTMIAQLHVKGFPTLLVETESGLKPLSHTDYYGQLERWEKYINTYI